VDADIPANASNTQSLDAIHEYVAGCRKELRGRFVDTAILDYPGYTGTTHQLEGRDRWRLTVVTASRPTQNRVRVALAVDNFCDTAVAISCTLSPRSQARNAKALLRPHSTPFPKTHEALPQRVPPNDRLHRTRFARR
jgi:hypothetical protein